MKALIAYGVAGILISQLALGQSAHSAYEGQQGQEEQHGQRAEDVQDAREVMSYRDMARVMQMDDTARFGRFMLDQLEWRSGAAGEARAAWDAQAWYGGDYNKVWLKTEGAYVADDSKVQDASAELLWDRVVARWWSLQAGARHDFGEGPTRTWIAFGVQGLGPQMLETEATVYVGDQGRTAARLKGQYQLLLTQRLVLQPYLEANWYGRPDPERQLGAGLSELELSIRLRYELRRELAPYVGVVWLRRFGGTADLARAAGGSAGEAQFTVGVRTWF